jgi:DNA-binding NarL/FixJ family response regulator
MSYELTVIEIQVLEHLANGRKLRDIGEILGLSENCVGQRVYVLKNKLGVATSAGMIARAFRAGLLK